METIVLTPSRLRAELPPRGPERREWWRHLLAQQRQSGLSVPQFCRRHGLCDVTFYAWRKRLTPPLLAPRAAFAPVRIVPAAPEPTPAGTGLLEIRLPARRRIRLRGPVDPAALATVLAVLEGRGC